MSTKEVHTWPMSITDDFDASKFLNGFKKVGETEQQFLKHLETISLHMQNIAYSLERLELESTSKPKKNFIQWLLGL